MIMVSSSFENRNVPRDENLRIKMCLLADSVTPCCYRNIIQSKNVMKKLTLTFIFTYSNI